MASSGMNKGIKTTRTVFAIIEYLQANETATLSEIADGIGKAPSTTHKHLQTLEREEYLVRNEDHYHLGLKFLRHGHVAKTQIEILDTVSPILDYVAEETGETVWFMVEEHGRGVYLDLSLGDHAVKTHMTIGSRRDLHVVAPGKAILAFLPSDRIDEIITSSKLTRKTENTITDPDELREELEPIRDRGVAFSEGEAISGMRAIAGPIIHEEEVLGSLAVAGPANRLRGEKYREDIPTTIQGATNEIELKISFS